MHTYDEPVYLISIVAKILDIHPQTLRQYERENLITPSRSDGRIRLYSQRDIERLKEQIDAMEQEIADLRYQLSQARNSTGVPPEKSLVTKKSIYELVIFKGK